MKYHFSLCFQAVTRILAPMVDTTVAKKIVPLLVQWSPSIDGTSDTVMETSTTDGEESVKVMKSALISELERQLMPQLFANPPSGWSFALRSHGRKQDWLLHVVDEHGERFCDVWLGKDPDKGWSWDGLVRVGDSESTPHVWQVYQRYSDGTYRRRPSLCRSLDMLWPRRSG